MEVETTVEEPLKGGGVKVTKETFAVKFKTLSTERPPSRNPLNFILGLFGICCASIATCGLCACVLTALLVNLLPIAKIVVGALYLDEKYCPPEKLAELLIAGGCITLLYGVVETIGRSRATRLQIQQSEESGQVSLQQQQKQEASPFLTAILSILRLASLIWLIVTCVFVYRIYPDVNYEDHNDPNYCHVFLYRFTFWVVTLSLALIVFVIPCLCCALCCGGVAIAATSSD